VNGERVERLRRNHRDEIDSAVLDDAMASAEREERVAGVYRDRRRRAVESSRARPRMARVPLGASLLGVAGGELAGKRIPRDRDRRPARRRAVNRDGRVDLGAELSWALRA
jgi:hypothetical protein